MHVVSRLMVAGVALAICISSPLAAPDSTAVMQPAAYIYKTVGGADLKAYVFSPPEQDTSGARAAIVVFHGGGWTMGAAEWAFPRARHFAELGMVAVAVEYRLSDQKSLTPLEAMADARAVIRWMRAQSDSLGIDPERIAAYGWSAGGHLAACAAIFDDSLSVGKTTACPNALLLVSAAVSLGSDTWFQRLLGQRAEARDLSPDEHVRKGMPPTLILQGDVDTVTPLAGAKRFCDRLRAAGNTCELHVYEGYGHLFTPAGIPDNEWPQPDATISADALAKADKFLASLGYIESR